MSFAGFVKSDWTKLTLDHRRAQAETIRPEERAQLTTLNHELRALTESSASLKDALDVSEAKLDKLETEEAKLVSRHERAVEKEGSLKRELATKKTEKADFEERKRQIA